MPKPIIPGRPNPQRIKELKQIAKLKEYTRPRSREEMNEEYKKQERMKRIIEILKNRNQLKYIPRYLPEAELTILSKRFQNRKSYEKKRNLEAYNSELEKEPLLIEIEPIIENIIDSFKKTKVKVLDLGAGEGNLGTDFNRLYPNIQNSNKKKVEYEGVDLLPSLNPKVKTFDFTYNRLPKNKYDLIVSMWSLDYVGDKLRAIQNCCDALQVNGKLILQTHTNKELLKTILEKYNPHLIVDINSTNGIIITKTKNLTTIIKLKLESVKPINKRKYFAKYNSDSNMGIRYGSTALKSQYSKK